MTYRVLWAPYAEERLEHMLQVTAEQRTLAAAAKEIDRYLITDRHAFGESRYDTVRVGYVHPLGVQFEVLDDVRTVVVYDVWRFGHK